MAEEGAQMIKPAAEPRNFGPVWRILRVIAGLSLVYYAWMMLDLVTHLFSPGGNPILLPFLFRWLSALTGTFTVVVAIFIIHRVPDNINGQLLLLWGVGTAGWSLRTDFGAPGANGLIQMVFGSYFLCIAFPALDGLIFHFPTGQPYPPRPANLTWWLLLASAAVGILAFLGNPGSEHGFSNPLFIPALTPFIPVMTFLIGIVLPALALISLVLRYRAGGPFERMQIRWLLWLAGMGVLISIVLTILAPTSNNSDPAMSVAAMTANVVGYIFWQAFPAAAIGIALLRYRLWDIDVIIRRTLLYTILTATFGLLYFGSVVLLRQVLGGLTGESNVAIVLSTLLIAALFEPVRQRVQTFIDQRFYRQKYDSVRALEEFSATARREVELENLITQLVGVVHKTVQPEQVSVWIRSAKRETRGDK
jgi:hypothetical protein